MSKGNTTENDILLKVFQATELSWSANASLYVALHSDDPGEAGTQSTNEITYGAPYARQAILRTSDGWDVAGNQASNDDLIQFPQCTSGSATATYVSIGTLASGAGQIIYSGALNSPLAISTGIQPQFAANALTVTED
jgi:hypothetical protein